jgi:two-component system sensor histidine kinase BaeS
MKIGITYRLFFSILGATCLAVFSLFLIMQWSIDRGFYQYLGTLGQNRLEQVASDLGRAYEQQGSWQFLKIAPPRFDIAPRWEIGGVKMSPQQSVQGPSDARDGNIRGHHPPGPHLFEDERPGGPLIILNADRQTVLGLYPKDEKVNFLPIIVHGKTVGYVGLLSPKHFLHPMQVRFLSQQKFALTLAAAGMVLVVVIISLPLARRLVRPISAMAAATHDIASGRYATRIPVSSSDELGRLARDFNAMALTLEKHEKERRQWVADISHELRTPVAVLQGEIEQLLDGICTISPDAIRSLHVETLRLKRLVEDLYQLSLSDIGALAYRKEKLDLVEVLTSSLETFRAEFGRKGIMLRPNMSGVSEVVVYADRERLNQLFANLFENSLRYTDPGGELVVGLAFSNGRVTIDFQDSKPGVLEQDLDRLFDRLYRVEGSRSRESGGAGLGLAISKNIVEAHEGTISAHQSPIGGLLIRITLPIAGGQQ